MAAKKTVAAPIDRPLSKAYLREFAGWSTSEPPGLSDPTSLRIMENVQITRGGGARVRPALRTAFTPDTWITGGHMVGGFEPFFTRDGRRALLYAVRRGAKVHFETAVYDDATERFAPTPFFDVFISAQSDTADTLAFTDKTRYVKYLQIDNKIFALSDGGETMRQFLVGAEHRARVIRAITVPTWRKGVNERLRVVHPDATWINNPEVRGSSVTGVPAQTPTTETLISSDDTQNVYNFAYFYTFENALGETTGSPVATVRAQRPWSQWGMFRATDGTEPPEEVPWEPEDPEDPEVPVGRNLTRAAAIGDPSKVRVDNPAMAADQLVAELPQSIYDHALGEGALRWNLYMYTWSDQDAMPVDGILVATRDMVPEFESPTQSEWRFGGWLQHTPAIDISGVSMPRPNSTQLDNYTEPSRAAQGVVAGDRMVLVNDKRDVAQVRWTSNQAGEYANFSPSKGGGVKTLTSGNLLVPVCVKLWQNPQSVDTLTVLCSGVDGESAAYYMAPATISGQAQSTAIMAFEATTATPGTVSPYGVEVLNNALYHPLDTELMKSSAANYNINHATMSLEISDRWVALRDKDRIVSSQHDNRLYYLVHNPEGAPLEDGCNGNELWVFDGAKDAGSWCRWLVQGVSLRRLQLGGTLHMAVTRPEGIYVLDEWKLTDDAPAPGGGTVQRPIPWKLETNTQGANRAHDAWAHLQQMGVVLGNWRGTLRYGLRGRDVHGRVVEMSKVYTRPVVDDVAARPLPTDVEDFLLVRRDMKEWFFFAESVDAQTSFGQLSLVQYRYTPVTVNVGYEFGSIETFEYGRGTNAQMNNGIPEPYLDTRRP